MARSQRQAGVGHILARHEAGAVAMADGYARKTGKLGVCCATSGPGTTNLITGIACAYSNQIPVLIITAQSALTHFGRGALQESADDGVDTVAMLKHCTRYSSLVSHQQQLMPKLFKAVSIALGSAPGPVHLSVPPDVMRQPFLSTQTDYWLPADRQPDMCAVETVGHLYQLIDDAKSGALVIGPDAAGAIADILRLATQKHWAIVNNPYG